jgi:hypothetical protein
MWRVGRGDFLPWLISPGYPVFLGPSAYLFRRDLMKKLIITLLAVACVYAFAEVRVHQPSPYHNLSVTWTELASGTNASVYVNAAPYPFKLTAFEVSQPEGVTNAITIDVIRAFDYQEQIVGEVTITNDIGQVGTMLDTTVTNRTWKTMTNRIFSVSQEVEHATYHADSTTKLPPVYIYEDDVIVVDFDYEDGFYFKLTGEK